MEVHYYKAERSNEQQQNRCREFPFDSGYKELNTNASPLTSQRNNYLCQKVENVEKSNANVEYPMFKTLQANNNVQ